MIEGQMFSDERRMITSYFVEKSGGWAVARGVQGPARCERCRGLGLRCVTINGVEKAGRCRCMILVDRINAWNRAKIPGKYAEATLESFDASLPETSVGPAACRAWLDRYLGAPKKDGPGLVLAGAPGRGKTHLAVALLRLLVFEHGVAARFVEFTHLIASIKEGFGRDEGEDKVLTPLVTAPILIIDELGKGRNTEFEAQVLDQLLTRRYNAEKPIIATTNYLLSRRGPASGSLALGGMETLEERLGERIFSRLTETHMMIGVGGEDFRRLRRRG